MALTSTTCWTADRATTPYDALYGERGRDTAVYADAPGGLIADLANSTHNTGEARDDSNLSIENLFGCAFGDVLRGDEGDNLLQGLGGNDALIAAAAMTRCWAVRGMTRCVAMPERMCCAATRGRTC